MGTDIESLTCDFDTNVNQVSDSISVPNRKTAQAIRKTLLYDKDWIELHKQYPSSRSRKTTTRITHTDAAVKRDQLKMMLDRLNKFTPDEINGLINQENKEFRSTTVAGISTVDKKLKQTWRTIGTSSVLRRIKALPTRSLKTMPC